MSLGCLDEVFSEMENIDAERGCRATVDFFRICIRQEVPEASDTEIDAATAACRAELEAWELTGKLKECVLERLQGYAGFLDTAAPDEGNT